MIVITPPPSLSLSLSLASRHLARDGAQVACLSALKGEISMTWSVSQPQKQIKVLGVGIFFSFFFSFFFLSGYPGVASSSSG